jgi:hypothetical protein
VCVCRSKVVFVIRVKFYYVSKVLRAIFSSRATPWGTIFVHIFLSADCIFV